MKEWDVRALNAALSIDGIQTLLMETPDSSEEFEEPIERWPHTDATKKRISDALVGKSKSEEHKKALSEAAKKRKASDKWKKSVSISLKGIMAKEKNPSWGKRWWNNGIECKFSKECPGVGYRLGRIINKGIREELV